MKGHLRTSGTARRLAWLLAIAVLVIGLLAFFRFARGVWHPWYVRMAGASTVAQRLAEIEARHPDLRGDQPAGVVLVAFKAERELLLIDRGRVRWRFPILAASGGPGPKLAAGDRQVPEGIYRIDAVNPDSAYHLSLRVSYPNEEDRERSRAAGVADPGGDIYIHGRDVSIGCIAIGDPAIDRVFRTVVAAGHRDVPAIIAPRDLLRHPPAEEPHRALYLRIQAALAALPALASQPALASPPALADPPPPAYSR